MPCSGPSIAHVERDAQQAFEDIMVYLEETYHIPPKKLRELSWFQDMFSSAEKDLRNALEKILIADTYDGF